MALFVLSLLGFLLVGANGPANSHLGCVGRPGSKGLAGFEETAFTVQPPPPAGFDARSPFAACARRRPDPTTRPASRALLAATEPLRQRGMMGRNDLAGYDAMLFLFRPTQDALHQPRTSRSPLSVAWFSAEGLLVGTADMAPCLASPKCPEAVPPSKYRFAVEVLKGGLGAIGVIPGTRVTLPT